MIEERSIEIIRSGGVKLRVRRSGMLQMMTFRVRKVDMGKEYFVELFLGRVIDMTELQRVANETGLPVEAENGRAFPEGKGSKDFMNLQT